MIEQLCLNLEFCTNEQSLLSAPISLLLVLQLQSLQLIFNLTIINESFINESFNYLDSY